LISLDQLENTLVVYTSDHGCHFRTRNPEYKRSGHDVSARVPMVMHGGPTTGWGRDERPFSLVDLAPTLCESAGLEPPEGAQGRSLLGELPGESFVQISESRFGRAVRTDRWKLIATADDASPTDRFADRLCEAEVYDLVADPYELVNLAGLPAYADVRRDLLDRLRGRMADAGEPAAELELLDVPPGPVPGQVGQLEVRDTDRREPKTA
ncbi:MAG: sulfatase/phosphatase domain-containing protein, partial [Planctomycetota bacterium]